MTARSARLETLEPRSETDAPRQAYNGSATPPGTEGQEAADLRPHESAVYVAHSVAIWGEEPFLPACLNTMHSGRSMRIANKDLYFFPRGEIGDGRA